MITFTNTVEVDRPPAEVFSYLADFENVPTWNYAIVETRKQSQGPVGVGTRYRQVREIPRRTEESFEVTAFEPPRKVAIRGTIGPFEGDLTYTLEPHGERTRLVNTAELQGRGIAGMLGNVAGGRVRDAVGRNLQDLKRILESGG